MRLPWNLGERCWVAMFALVLPLAQAQAQECVEFQGLEHCAIGEARLRMTEEGLRLDSGASEKDGVSISLPNATSWTASSHTDESSSEEQRTLFTAMTEGAPSSTATIQTTRESRAFSATFTGAGEASTYSALIYYRGALQAAVGNLHNGEIAARAMVGGNPPNCRPRGQTPEECYVACKEAKYTNCNYCYGPVCQPVTSGFHTTPQGACQWVFAHVDRNELQLSDGRVVRGDQIVLTEEVNGPGSYPYLGFDRMLLQSTARSVTLVNESVTSAK